MSGLSSTSIDQLLEIHIQTFVSTTIAFVSVCKSVRLNRADFCDVASMLSRLWYYLSICTYVQKLHIWYWPEYRRTTPSSLSSTSVTPSLVRTFLNFATILSHIPFYRCLKHSFHHNCPWLPTRRSPIIWPHVHTPWWEFPQDHNYHCFCTLYVTLSTTFSFGSDLSICYRSDIFEMTYRSSMRPEILIHHFCVCLFFCFQCSSEGLIYTIQTIFAMMALAVSLEVTGEDLIRKSYRVVDRRPNWLILEHPATITMGMIWLFQVCRNSDITLFSSLIYSCHVPLQVTTEQTIFIGLFLCMSNC